MSLKLKHGRHKNRKVRFLCRKTRPGGSVCVSHPNPASAESAGHTGAGMGTGAPPFSGCTASRTNGAWDAGLSAGRKRLQGDLMGTGMGIGIGVDVGIGTDIGIGIVYIYLYIGMV